MITGKQLREARGKKKMSVADASKIAGVSLDIIYAWEAMAHVDVRNREALAKLLSAYDLSIEDKLRASLPKKAARPTIKLGPIKAHNEAQTEKRPSTTIPASELPAIAEFLRLFGFFMADPARRANLLRLLALCEENEISFADLRAVFSGLG